MNTLAALVVLGQLAGQAPGGGAPANVFSIGDRTEVRFRSNPIVGGNPTTEDVETVLMSNLAFEGRHESLTLAYYPRFTYDDISGERDLTLMHSGRILATWWTPRFRLTGAIDGAIGSQSVVGLASPLGYASDTATTGTAGASLVPAALPPAYLPTYVGVLTTGLLRATLSASYLLSRRWSTLSTAYYAMSAGLDWQSQRPSGLPPNLGGGGSELINYSASHRDQLGTQLTGTYVSVLQTPTPVGEPTTSTAGVYYTLSFAEVYRRMLSERSQAGLTAGVGYLHAPSGLAAGTTTGPTGVGQAFIATAVPLRNDATLALRAAADVGTAYNPIIGVVEEQASAALSVGWVERRMSVVAVGGAAASLPLNTTDATRVVSGSLTIGYRPGDAVQLQTGVRAYAEVLPTLPGVAPTTATVTSYPPQWAVFAAIVLTAPSVEF